MSKFENMNAKEIAICLETFYEASQKYSGTATLAGTTVYFRSGKEPIHIYRSDFDEGIKILREDYEVFWTPDTKPDDLKWKINKRRMKELGDRIAQGYRFDGILSNPGCAVTGNDYLYRRELGLPDNATVADICEKIRRLMDESCVLNDKVLKLEDADRLRRHWHAKYEDEHKECVRLSKLHAADKEKKDEQDTIIHNLRDNNTTLEYSVAALKKRLRTMEAEAAEKETKHQVITDTLRGNLVDSVEECKRLNAKIKDLERTIRTLDDEEDE